MADVRLPSPLLVSLDFMRVTLGPVHLRFELLRSHRSSLARFGYHLAVVSGDTWFILVDRAQ